MKYIIITILSITFSSNLFAQKEKEQMLGYFELYVLGDGDYSLNQKHFSHPDSVVSWKLDIRTILAAALETDSINIISNKPSFLEKKVRYKSYVAHSSTVLLDQLQANFRFSVIDTILSRENWVLYNVDSTKAKKIAPEDLLATGDVWPENYKYGDDLVCLGCTPIDIAHGGIVYGHQFFTVDKFPDETYYAYIKIPFKLLGSIDLLDKWLRENMGIGLRKEIRPVKFKYIKF